MKTVIKIISPLLLLCLLLFFSLQKVSAQENTITSSATPDSAQSFNKQTDELIDSLPQSTKELLNELGLDDVNIYSLNNLSFEKIIEIIKLLAKDNYKTPFSITATVIAIMLLCAVLQSFRDSLKSNAMQEVISVVATLCITASLLSPSMKLISDSVETIKNASGFMLAYIPIALGVLAYCGQGVSGSTYYSFMVFACQAITQVSSKIVVPFLNLFLGISISSSLTNKVNLSPFCTSLSKITKWVLAFAMTIFSGLLSFKTIIATSFDSISTRAVRFTLSSFVPIVGTALSEAYKTVQSSVKMLRSGMGVIVIFAIAVVFLPIVIRCLVWLFSLSLCKSFGEIVNLPQPCRLLSGLSSVISTILAVLLCIMAVYIISTALVMTLGGSGG